jgi:hypothetical protein
MRTEDGRLFSPDPRQEYARTLLNDPHFSRWLGDDSPYIEIEVLTVPAGKDWTILMEYPEDAPLAQDGIQALLDAINRPPPQPAEEEQPDSLFAETLPAELSNLVALIGPPHEGQSVMLRRLTAQLASNICNRTPEHNPSDDNFLYQQTGIFVSLENYEHQPVSSRRLERLITATISDYYPDMGNQLLELFQATRGGPDPSLKRPNYVFLFDGLDKISDDYRLDAAREILAMAEALPEHHFVVSCSQRVFPTLIANRCCVLLLQPVNERIVLRYLRRRNPEQSHTLFRRIVENQLLELTTDPVLLTIIYQRFTESESATLTRNELVLDYLDQALAGIPAPYTQDDAARKTLITLGWHSRWLHKETLSISEIFSIMQEIRQHRDYNLETLYHIFHQEDLLMNVGQHQIRFVHPLLHSYCAALKLLNLADLQQRVQDILVMCSVPHLQKWWEDTLYALVGLLTNPIPLFERFADAAHNWGGPHRVLLARALACLSFETLRSIPLYLLQKILDACVVGLDATREPSIEMRAAILTALGRINQPTAECDLQTDSERLELLRQIEHRLIHILISRVRQTSTGSRYEYTRVRIAAARALRTRFSVFRKQTQAAVRCHPSIEQSFAEDMTPEELYHLFVLWSDQQRQQLRDILTNVQQSSPERAVAAFALGDIASHADDEDVRALLEIIMQTEDEQTDEDTIWAATDALTLFDVRQVEPLLIELFHAEQPFPPRSIEQLAYIAGRVRAHDETIIIWLIKLFLLNPELTIKAKALQSLAWIGEDHQSQDWFLKALRSPEIKQALQSLNVTVDQLPRNLIQTTIINIASWDIESMMQLGFIQEMGPLPPDEAAAQERAILYLRRKAIEAVAWIGDNAIAGQLRGLVHTWPLELREAWYTTTALLKKKDSHA